MKSKKSTKRLRKSKKLEATKPLSRGDKASTFNVALYTETATPKL